METNEHESRIYQWFNNAIKENKSIRDISFKDIQQWLNSCINEVDTDLDDAIESEPGGYRCGMAIGYKQCLSDIIDFINILENFGLENCND